MTQFETELAKQDVLELPVRDALSLSDGSAAVAGANQVMMETPLPTTSG